MFSDVNTKCNHIHINKIVDKNLHYSHFVNYISKCEVTLLSHRIHEVLERTISGQATFLRMDSNVNVRICHMDERKREKNLPRKETKNNIKFMHIFQYQRDVCNVACTS